MKRYSQQHLALCHRLIGMSIAAQACGQEVNNITIDVVTATGDAGFHAPTNPKTNHRETLMYVGIVLAGALCEEMYRYDVAVAQRAAGIPRWTSVAADDLEGYFGKFWVATAAAVTVLAKNDMLTEGELRGLISELKQPKLEEHELRQFCFWLSQYALMLHEERQAVRRARFPYLPAAQRFASSPITTDLRAAL